MIFAYQKMNVIETLCRLNKNRDDSKKIYLCGLTCKCGHKCIRDATECQSIRVITNKVLLDKIHECCKICNIPCQVTYGCGHPLGINQWEYLCLHNDLMYYQSKGFYDENFAQKIYNDPIKMCILMNSQSNSESKSFDFVTKSEFGKLVRPKWCLQCLKNFLEYVNTSNFNYNNISFLINLPYDVKQIILNYLHIKQLGLDPYKKYDYAIVYIQYGTYTSGKKYVKTPPKPMINYIYNEENVLIEMKKILARIKSKRVLEKLNFNFSRKCFRQSDNI